MLALPECLAGSMLPDRACMRQFLTRPSCRRLCAAQDLQEGVLLRVGRHPQQGGARALAHGQAQPRAPQALQAGRRQAPGAQAAQRIGCIANVLASCTARGQSTLSAVGLLTRGHTCDVKVLLEAGWRLVALQAGFVVGSTGLQSE